MNTKINAAQRLTAAGNFVERIATELLGNYFGPRNIVAASQEGQVVVVTLKGKEVTMADLDWIAQRSKTKHGPQGVKILPAKHAGTVDIAFYIDGLHQDTAKRNGTFPDD